MNVRNGQAGLYDYSEPHNSGKRIAGGEPTTNLVFSAHVGNNSELFAQTLDLHVQKGATIADVTYGQGAFWREIEPDVYTLLASDIVQSQELTHKRYAV